MPIPVSDINKVFQDGNNITVHCIGAGGGGGGGNYYAKGGDGADGLIVIEYTPGISFIPRTMWFN